MGLDDASRLVRSRFGEGAYLQAGLGGIKCAGIVIGRHEVAAGGESWEAAFDRLAAEIRRRLPNAAKALGLE
jgi:hypothetical protein